MYLISTWRNFLVPERETSLKINDKATRRKKKKGYSPVKDESSAKAAVPAGFYPAKRTGESSAPARLPHLSLGCRILDTARRFFFFPPTEDFYGWHTWRGFVHHCFILTARSILNALFALKTLWILRSKHPGGASSSKIKSLVTNRHSVKPIWKQEARIAETSIRSAS